MSATQRSFNYRRLATLQRGPAAKALAACLAIDVAELVDPAAGAADDLLNATATVASPVTVLAAAMKAPGLAKLAAHGARKVTFTTAGTTADAPATVDIVGEDIDGNAISETLALAQTAAAVTSVKAYSTLTSVTYPAADGTSATIAIGIADVFGLPSKVRDLGGGPNILREIEDGADVTTAGTFESAATSAPYGSWAPDTTPDGSADFGLVYEHDPS